MASCAGPPALSRKGSTAYDVIVVGLGAWGGACLRSLTKRGFRTLGIDRYAPPHTHGSTHGRLRVVLPGTPHAPGGPRIYAHLETAKLDAWRELERESGLRLLIDTGWLAIGRVDSQVIIETRRNLNTLEVPYEVLESRDVERRFPTFRLGSNEVAVWSPRTAVARVEATIQAQLDLAVRGGAEIRTGEVVESWSAGSQAVEVQTSRGHYEAERLVLAPGGWASDLIGDLLEVQSERVVIAWFEPKSYPERYGAEQCPVFVIEADPPHDLVYGTPIVDGAGVRLATHRGDKVSHPDMLDRVVHPDDINVMLAAVGQHLIGLQPVPLEAAVCFYPHAPDRRFCLGVHPQYPEVIVAVGSSGHGFQFSQLVGRLVTDLVVGDNRFDLSPFAPGRFLVRPTPSRPPGA